MDQIIAFTILGLFIFGGLLRISKMKVEIHNENQTDIETDSVAIKSANDVHNSMIMIKSNAKTDIQNSSFNGEGFVTIGKINGVKK